MLYIRGNLNREFRNLLNQSNRYINFDIHSAVSSLQGVYVRRFDTEYAYLPYVVNGFNIKHSTYMVSDYDGYTAENISILIKNKVSEQIENEYNIIRVLTTNIDEAVDAMDFLENPIPGIQELYGKCAEQMGLREGIPGVRYVIKIKNNSVIVFTNREDNLQMSDVYLTIGVLPVLYPAIKEKFNQQELEYCKELVHRSQLKRIVNIDVQKYFDVLITTDKYKKLSAEMLLNTTVNRIIDNRLYSARETIDHSHRDMERALQVYQDARSAWTRASKLLVDLDGSKAELKEELQLALKLDTIKEVVVSGDVLTMIFATPVRFFDTDEAECAIRRLEDGFVKSFITDIFIEQKYKLHVAALFKFTLGENTNWLGTTEIEYQHMLSANAIYNPHIQLYRCVGDYRVDLIKAQTDRDLLLHNNIASASTASINFKDGTVMHNWFERLQYMWNNWDRDYSSSVLFRDIKCIETSDGARYSLKEIYVDRVLDSGELEQPTELDVEEL